MVSERKQSKENSVDSRDGEVRTRVRLPSSPLDAVETNTMGSTSSGLNPLIAPSKMIARGVLWLKCKGEKPWL